MWTLCEIITRHVFQSLEILNYWSNCPTFPCITSIIIIVHCTFGIISYYTLCLRYIFVPHFFTWTFSHLIQTRCRAFIFLARIASLNHSPFTILMASCDVWFYIIFHSRPSFIHTGRVIKLISMIFRRPQPFQQKSSTERCPINAWRRRQSHDSFTWQRRRFADWPHTDVGGNETHAFIFRWMTSQARIKNARNQRRREKWRPFVLEKIQLCDVCFLFRILFQPISPLLKPASQSNTRISIMCHVTIRWEREKMI